MYRIWVGKLTKKKQRKAKSNVSLLMQLNVT